MPAPAPIPDVLREGPFTREEALRAGLRSQALLGQRFHRIFPRVWVCADYEMAALDWIDAARLAMPERAMVTGITRIQDLGLEFGPLRPFHFVVSGDLHLDLDDIFLHRTIVLPPLDDEGVTPAAAFLAYAAEARVIDAIKVGDWLLHQRHMTLEELLSVAFRERWRPGSREVRWISRYLDAGSSSLKESESRAVLVFAGLPRPETNKDIRSMSGELLARGDLVYLLWKLAIEYEGRQHLFDRHQFNRDIDRYRDLRDDGWRYVQITKEKLDRPKKLVTEVYAQLVRGGYTGSAPEFGPRWSTLFEPISAALPRRAVS
jgi:hypothetical protein